MRHRLIGWTGLAAMAVAVGTVGTAPVFAQAGASASLRTPEGTPDLQGVWSFATLTSLERPKELAGKATFSSPAEAAEFARREMERRDEDRRDNDPTGVTNGTQITADVARAYNQFWWDYGTSVVGTHRTSLVIDPPDGRIPARTQELKERQARLNANREGIAYGPENRGPGERCIHHAKAGPPIMPGGYNNNIQIVQGDGWVGVYNEQIHDVRMIPLDGRAHLRGVISQWMGDSVGRWEGNTLVVDTVNFNGKMNFQGTGEKLHLIERFTRADANTLLYEFTVDDPSSFARQWTAQIPMPRSNDQVYEYACHEGNYGMFGILNSARATEREAAEAAKKGSN